MPDGVVACPHCAEPILAAAKKCKHCGEWLEKKPQRLSTFGYINVGVGAVSGVVGFLKEFTTDQFGLIDLLVEIGIFGVAMYVALIPTAFLHTLLAWAIPQIEENDRVEGAFFVGGGLLIAAAIRFGLFAEDLTADLDSIGTFFSASIGVAVVVAAFWAVGRAKGTA